MGARLSTEGVFKGTWDELGKAYRDAARPKRRGKELRRRAKRRAKEDLPRGKKDLRRGKKEFFGDRWAPIRQSGGTISDADFLNRNDGGMAKKTRTF